MYTLKFDEMGSGNIDMAGGKGANLGEMFRASFPVPGGFCVTSSAFDEFIKWNNLKNEAGMHKTAEENKYVSESEVLESIRRKIETAGFPTEMENAIKEGYSLMGNNVRVAVRSSATAEDLPEASFAGQQETFLNIKGIDELYTAIKRCFASLYNDRAVSYRRRNGFENVKVSIAVVIQEMIDSDAAGVLFTVNPVSGNNDELMINASWGLGESVVSGRVTPDMFICGKKRNTIQKKILGSKEISVVYDRNGGTCEIPNSELQRASFCITHKDIRQLIKIGKQVEAHYGCPQDIEWAIKDGRLYLLQARPITAAAGANILDNRKKQSRTQRAAINNFLEHCPDPLYPLDFEPIKIVGDAKASVFKMLGVNTGDELDMDNDGVFDIKAQKTGITLKVLKIPFMIKDFLNYDNNSKITDAGFAGIRESLRKIEGMDFSALSNTGLAGNLKTLLELTRMTSFIRFRYNIFPSVAISKLINGKLQKIEKGLTEFDLLGGLAYKTLCLNNELQAVSEVIKKDKALYENLNRLPVENVPELEVKLQETEQTFPVFSTKLQNLLREFGWKSSSSYAAFSSASWNENKSGLLLLLRLMAAGSGKQPENTKYQNLYTEIGRKFSSESAKKLYRRIDEIRNYHVNREESLYILENCFGLARLTAAEISIRFPQLFKDEKDILYLTVDELLQLCYTEDWNPICTVMERRKTARIKNLQLWNGLLLDSKGSEARRLPGISGNRGSIKGRACIVLEMNQFSKLKAGDILVCRYTDPSWTPLFSMAAAIVSDTGGPLSHSSIVAREYNIPAVLGIGNATARLRDGDEILVDGDNGQVLLL